MNATTVAVDLAKTVFSRSHAPAWECRLCRSSGSQCYTPDARLPRWSVGARSKHLANFEVDYIA